MGEAERYDPNSRVKLNIRARHKRKIDVLKLLTNKDVSEILDMALDLYAEENLDPESLKVIQQVENIESKGTPHA